MRAKAKRVCRANKFLLVPKPRLVEFLWGWADECPTGDEVITLLLERIEVHRLELADTQNILNQIVEHHPEYAHLLPRHGLSLVVSNRPGLSSIHSTR